MSLTRQLAGWDGKSSEDITKIYQSHSNEAGFIDEICNCLTDTNLQTAATWLIKHALEQNCTLTSEQQRLILTQVSSASNWHSQLHLLQSLSYLIIPEDLKCALERFIRHCLTSDNKFLRAWAYSGLYYLALQYPEYKTEVNAFFELALTDEAPSVKARIRQLLKSQ